MSLFPFRRKEKKERAPARITPGTVLRDNLTGQTWIVNDHARRAFRDGTIGVWLMPGEVVLKPEKNPPAPASTTQRYYPGQRIPSPQENTLATLWKMVNTTSANPAVSSPPAVSAPLSFSIQTPGKCPKCGKYLIAGQLAGQMCRQCATDEAMKAPASTTLEVVHQDDLIQATKYARLSLDKDGKPCFRGTGYAKDPYYTETESTCGQRKNHLAPDPDCDCGFWVGTREGSRLATWEPNHVALEVELGGTVLECARPGTRPQDPPWGYRAQWQRVLSVSLFERCAMQGNFSKSWVASYPCDSAPLFLCAIDRDGYTQLLTACQAHVQPDKAIKKPVSFLREFLQTEIRPGTVSDTAVIKVTKVPQNMDIAELQKAWESAVRQTVCKMVPADQLIARAPAVKPAGATVSIDWGNGVRYTLKSDGMKWQVDRVDSAEMDALRAKAEEIQKLYREGKLSYEQVSGLSTYITLT